MSEVDFRWRPSGGRGEYEHVPSDVVMDRLIVVAHPGLPGVRIRTDVHGRLRDGKPRLRRDNPNEHGTLNVPPLIAALALLPAPVRTKPTTLILPLQADGYVASSITVHAEIEPSGEAVCTPIRLQVLLDPSTIDLFGRLIQVGRLVTSTDLPEEAADAASKYLQLAEAGLPSAEFAKAAKVLRHWLEANPDAQPDFGLPSSSIALEPAPGVMEEAIKYQPLSVDETRRRLVSHYRLDRDPKVRSAKIRQFNEEHGTIHCENCGFSFGGVYGSAGEGYIEVHHRKKLASLLPNTMTTLSDLMLLCANCHRVVHRKREPLTPEQLAATTKFKFT